MSTSLEKGNRSFWQRPEGRVGLVISALVLAASGYGLFLALPTLITFVQKYTRAGRLVPGAAALFYLVLDAKVRVFLSYVYRSFFSSVTGFAIELDPNRNLAPAHARARGKAVAHAPAARQLERADSARGAGHRRERATSRERAQSGEDWS